MIDLVFLCARDVVSLVESGRLSADEIPVFDWIRFFSRLPAEAREELRRREAGREPIKLPSSLGTACRLVAGRVRADTATDGELPQTLDRESLEQLINEAFVGLRRHAVQIARESRQ